MKDFAPGLAAHLEGGVTNLCWCWRLIRRDGTILGFTDHDRAIAFDGSEHEPETGFDASAATAHAGLQMGAAEVSGAFSSARIAAADLDAGLYDNARVETWLVDWAEPENRHLMRVGHVGEVRREGEAFSAEIRGLAHLLDQERGRLFRFTCDAELGDARCGIAMADWTEEAIVLGTDGRRSFRAAIPGGRASGTFDRGLATVLTGASAGAKAEILRHERGETDDLFEFGTPLAGTIAAGDLVRLEAGCDKRFETCRLRFANQANFRGFPHMPGNDFALSYARPGERNRGRSLRD